MLDGSPPPANTSTKDPQQGKAEYVADAVKQALLLPSDMTKLITLRTHKVFLSLKNDQAKVNKIWNSFICLPILTFSSSFPFYLFFLLCFLHRLSKLPIRLRSWWTILTGSTRARREEG